MNAALAKNHALYLMNHYGLSDWTFQFTRKKRVFGTCYFKLKEIHLSSVLTECNSVAQVHDTILHEIAHALAYLKHGEVGHGKRWRDICVQIGAEPKQYMTSKAVRVKPKYYMINSESGEKLGSYHRLPKWHREVGLRFVTGKRKETLGKLQIIPA
jgi:predicted SprT family Zn-dependent metalloprotease